MVSNDYNFNTSKRRDTITKVENLEKKTNSRNLTTTQHQTRNNKTRIGSKPIVRTMCTGKVWLSSLLFKKQLIITLSLGTI